MRVQPFMLAAGLVSATLLSLTSVAWADQAICFSDDDCDDGEECIRIPGSGCEGEFCEPEYEAYCFPVGAAMPRPGGDPWACSSDADCDEGAYCVPGLDTCAPLWAEVCATDADCGPNLRCTDVGEWDEGGGEGWGEAEPAPMPAPAPGAEPGSPGAGRKSGDSLPNLFCMPDWIRPDGCSVDSDCADGFACARFEICSCPGGAGGGWDGGGEIPPDAGAPEPFHFKTEGCECFEEDEGYCELVEVSCATDADCANAWTCGDNILGGDCAVDSEGNVYCPDGEESPERICYPPYFEELMAFGSAGGGFAEGAADRAMGGGRPGTPQGPGAGQDAADENGGVDSGTRRPDRSDGGCAAAPGGSGSIPGAIGVLALLGVLLRRREAAEAARP